jgi:hypothetical protein
MKKTMISIMILLLVAGVLLAEGGKQLKQSDWQHVFYPGAAYITIEQTLEFAGMEVEDAEAVSLSIVLLLNIGKEYYDYKCGGVSSLEDMELSVIGIVTSYYLNKGIRAILHPKKNRRARALRSQGSSTQGRRP